MNVNSYFVWPPGDWAVEGWNRCRECLAAIDALETEKLAVFAGAFLLVGNATSRLWVRLRSATTALAGGIFLAVAAWPIIVGDPRIEVGVHSAFRSLLEAGVFLGTVWILGPLVDAVYRATFQRGFRCIWRFLVLVRRICNAALAAPGRFVARIRDRKWRTLAQRAALERQRSDQDRSWREENERRRRLDAKLRCEFQYADLAPELAKRVSRKQFNELLQKFLGDHLPLDVIDGHADRLGELLERHRAKIEPPKDNIDSLIQWYENTRRAIEKLPISETFKKSQFATLNIRFAEMMRKFLQEDTP